MVSQPPSISYLIMRNHQTTTQIEATVALVSQAGFNSLPPTGNWVDNLLDNLFSDDDLPKKAGVLTPFDYEGFLRGEGLSC